MDKEKLIEGYIVTDLVSGNFQDFITKIKMMNLTPEEVKAMMLFGDAQVSPLLADVISAIDAGTPYDEPVTKLFNYVKTITKSNFSVDDLSSETFESTSQGLASEKKVPEGELSMIALSERIDSLSETISKMADVIQNLAYNYNIALSKDEELDTKVNMLQGNINKSTFVLGKLIDNLSATTNMSEDDYDFSDEEEFDDENFEEGSLPAGTGLTDLNPPAATEEVTIEKEDDVPAAEAYEEGIKDGVEAALNASELVDEEFSEPDDDVEFSDEELDQIAEYLSFSDDENPEDYFDEDDDEFSDDEAVDALDQIFSDEEEFDDEQFEEENPDDKSKAWYDGYNTAEKDEYKNDETSRPEDLAAKFGYESGSKEYGDFVKGYEEAIAKQKDADPTEVAPAKDKTGEGDAATADNCDHSFSFSEGDASERYKSLQTYFSANE